MRIIAGQYKSRILSEPKGNVAHPMGERVRAALFNILHDVSGKTVLDAFAGSGALAIEAISRGAESAVAVEKDHRVYRVLKENVESLGLEDRIHFTRANVHQWLKNNEESDEKQNKRFDIIFADPPFDKYNSGQIQKLVPFLNDDGIIVLSHPSDEKSPKLNGLELQGRHEYGNATLALYV